MKFGTACNVVIIEKMLGFQLCGWATYVEFIICLHLEKLFPNSGSFWAVATIVNFNEGWLHGKTISEMFSARKMSSPHLNYLYPSRFLPYKETWFCTKMTFEIYRICALRRLARPLGIGVPCTLFAELTHGLVKYLRVHCTEYSY